MATKRQATLTEMFGRAPKRACLSAPKPCPLDTSRTTNTTLDMYDRAPTPRGPPSISNSASSSPTSRPSSAVKVPSVPLERSAADEEMDAVIRSLTMEVEEGERRVARIDTKTAMREEEEERQGEESANIPDIAPNVVSPPVKTETTVKSAPKRVVQLKLDLGQKKGGSITCPKCKMTYAPATSDDKLHQKFCSSKRAKLIHGWGVVCCAGDISQAHLGKKSGGDPWWGDEDILEQPLLGPLIVRCGPYSSALFKENFTVAVAHFARREISLEHTTAVFAVDPQTYQLLSVVFFETFTRQQRAQYESNGVVPLIGVTCALNGSSNTGGISSEFTPRELIFEILSALTTHAVHGYTMTRSQMLIREDVGHKAIFTDPSKMRSYA